MNQFIKLRNLRKFVQVCGDNGSKNCRRCFTRTSCYFIVQDLRNIYPQNESCPSYYFFQIREFAKTGRGKMIRGGKLKSQQLTDEEIADVIDIEDYREQLNMVIENLKKEYVEHLSIRSVAGNIDKIIVKIEDQEFPLNELATISKKNQNLIAINMADFPEGLKPTMQAILDSGANLNPQQEGTMIYVSVPKLTREHRENLAKGAKSLFGKSKNEVRSIQNMFVKKAKEKTGISEDLIFSATNQIMAIAEQCTADLEKIMKTKQKELLGDS